MSQIHKWLLVSFGILPLAFVDILFIAALFRFKHHIAQGWTFASVGSDVDRLFLGAIGWIVVVGLWGILGILCALLASKKPATQTQMV